MPAKTIEDDVFIEIWNDCDQPTEVVYRLYLKGYNFTYWSVTSKARRLKKTHKLKDFRRKRDGKA